MAEKLRSQTIYPDFTNTVAVPLATNVLKAAGIENSEEKIYLLTYKEVLERRFADLDGRLRARQEEKFFMYQVANGVELITFSDVGASKKMLENLLGFSSVTQEIRGTVAYKGKAVGRACIVFNNEAPFSDGDILVSINSSPKLMPYIIKCSAIITDEGGLGCHAAIISRELKKPCIIGTKVATKVLKDGDMIEVDATNGVVRKINL